MAKNPIWQEVGVELGSTEKQLQLCGHSGTWTCNLRIDQVSRSRRISGHVVLIVNLFFFCNIQILSLIRNYNICFRPLQSSTLRCYSMKKLVCKKGEFSVVEYKKHISDSFGFCVIVWTIKWQCSTHCTENNKTSHLLFTSKTLKITSKIIKKINLYKLYTKTWRLSILF